MMIKRKNFQVHSASNKSMRIAKNISKKFAKVKISRPVMMAAVVVVIFMFGFASFATYQKSTRVSKLNMSNLVGKDPKICMYENTHYCIQANGIGNALTVNYNAGSEWTIEDGLSGTVMFQNANGHCLYASSINYVYLSGPNCTATNNSERWRPSALAPWEFESVAFPYNYLSTAGIGNGYAVLAHGKQKGIYYNWLYE